MPHEQIPQGSGPEQAPTTPPGLPVAQPTSGDVLKSIMAERGLTVRLFGHPGETDRRPGVSEYQSDLRPLYSRNPDTQNAGDMVKMGLDVQGELPDEYFFSNPSSHADPNNPSDPNQLYGSPLAQTHDYDMLGRFLTPQQEPNPAIRGDQLRRLLDTSNDEKGSATVRAERMRRRIDYIHAQRAEEDGVPGYGLEPHGGARPLGYDGVKTSDVTYMRSRYGVQITTKSKGHAEHVPGNKHEYQPRVISGAKAKAGDRINDAKDAAVQSSMMQVVSKKTRALKSKLKRDPSKGPRRKI